MARACPPASAATNVASPRARTPQAPPDQHSGGATQVTRRGFNWRRDAPAPVISATTLAKDFSLVLSEVPGAFVALGACPGDREPMTAAPNHSAKAEFDDAVLLDGARLYAELAVRRLKLAARSS